MKKKSIVAAIILLLCFVFLLILVSNEMTTSFDEGIYQGIISIKSKPVDTFFIYFTKIGNTLPTLLIALIMLFIFKNKKERIMTITSLISVMGMNQLWKYIVQRPRPPVGRRLIKQGGFSFPSGHTMAALCIYGLLLYFCYHKIKNKKLRIFTMIFLTLMILLIGISRIYVGVHYPTDVIGGYFLALGILILDISVVNHYVKGE